MMPCHLEQQHEVLPRAVFWAQPLLPLRSLAAIPIALLEGQDEVWAWPPLLSYSLSEVTSTSVRNTVRCSALPQEHWKVSPNSSFSLFLFFLWLPSFCRNRCGERGRVCWLQAARVSCGGQSYQCRLVCPESLHATATSPSVTKASANVG